MIRLLVPAMCAIAFSNLSAASLKDATIVHPVNDVRTGADRPGARPAAPSDVVPDGSSVFTGERSRSELQFADRTVARLGANTSLEIRRDSRDLFLRQGTLLLQAPAFRGTTRVHLGALTALAGRATFLVEHLPGRLVKIAVLEGEVRLAAPGFLGDSSVLVPGKLLITNPEARRIPDPVDVDLRTLAATSSMLNPSLAENGDSGAQPLASQPRIDRNIRKQERQVADQILYPTNLAIFGSGAEVMIPQEMDSADQ